MKKLTKKQAEKLKDIQDFLDTDIGKTGLLIDSEITYIYSIKKVYHNATGICIKGHEAHNFKNTVIDRIETNQLSKFYHALRIYDGDFKYYLNNLK